MNLSPTEDNSPRRLSQEQRRRLSIRKGSAKLTPIPPGVKIGANSIQPTEDNMRYLKQLGVTWVSIAPQAPYDAETFIKQREQWESNGFKVYNIGSGSGPERQSAQHAGGHAESAWPRSEDRRVPELHSLHRQGRSSVLHLCPHGQRHLVERPDHNRPRVRCARRRFHES